MKFKYSILILVVVIALAFGGCNSCSFFGEDSTNSVVINAYDIAVKNGFEGTEEEWLASLKGKDGDNAQTVYTSLYEDAKAHGFEGDFDAFLEYYFNNYFESLNEDDLSNVINGSLLSAVSVYSTFTTTVVTYDRRGNKYYYDKEYDGAGAGVIVSLDAEKGDAYVLTNFHVIYDKSDKDGYADTVKLYVYGRELENLAVEAQIVGATATYDIAVLKVTDSEIFRTSNLRAVEFADSNLVGAGDSIYTIGNPEATGISVTSGIVSVDSENIIMKSPKDETTVLEYRVIRIDAAVNGGNSGGGLFDKDGRLVGIVNAKIVSSSIENIAYAIPSSLVYKVYQNILKYCDGDQNKQVMKSVIGVTVEVVNSYAKYDELLCDTRIIEEVGIKAVLEGSSADGKLQVGDKLISYEYKGKTYTIDRRYVVIESALTFEEGETVNFKVKRNGEEVVVPIQITAPSAIN